MNFEKMVINIFVDTCNKRLLIRKLLNSFNIKKTITEEKLLRNINSIHKEGDLIILRESETKITAECIYELKKVASKHRLKIFIIEEFNNDEELLDGYIDYHDDYQSSYDDHTVRLGGCDYNLDDPWECGLYNLDI